MTPDIARRVAGSAGLAVAMAWLLVGAAAVPCLADDPRPGPPPQRVVSMNLCTDQLAMLLAGDGQLHSVSYLSSNADVSVMAGRAVRFALNHGRAEEIFLMKPGLVLAGQFTKSSSVALLRKLGLEVVTFAPVRSFADIEAGLIRMGRLLGQGSKAAATVSAFRRAVAGLSQPAGSRGLAAMYYANSYTSGRGTLADEIVRRSGFENLGAKLGYAGTAKLPLELLVMGRPDLVVGGRRMTRERSRSFEIAHHPALRRVTTNHAALVLSDKYWICGTPFTLDAVRSLVAAARAVPRQKQ